MLGSNIGDLSKTCLPCDCELEACEVAVRSDRTDAAQPLRDDVGDNGVALLVAILAMVAVESRLEYLDAVEIIDILDRRRDR